MPNKGERENACGVTLTSSFLSEQCNLHAGLGCRCVSGNYSDDPGRQHVGEVMMVRAIRSSITLLGKVLKYDLKRDVRLC